MTKPAAGEPAEASTAGLDHYRSLFESSQAKLEGQVSPEFLRSQIEVGTRVCTNITEAAEELRWLRRTVCETAEEHGLSVVAAYLVLLSWESVAIAQGKERELDWT